MIFLGEAWKDVKGFEGLYEISSLGRVKSINKKGSVYTGAGKPRKEYAKKDKLIKGWVQDYQVVDLTKNGKNYSCKVHRLVAEAFIPNPYNKPQVNHIDEDKLNNRLDNLEWMTPMENVNHGTGIARRSKSQGKPVIALRKDESIRFNSIKEAAINFNVDPSSISHVLAGREKHVKGFDFKFAQKNHKKIGGIINE